MGVRESHRVKELTFSPIRSLMGEAAKMAAQGFDVVNLGIGEPDFDTPSYIVEALSEAAKRGSTHHYTDNRGIVELRRAISERYERELGLSYTTDEVICTVGATEGVYLGMSSFLNPGDEVLIPDPAWLNYLQMSRFNGCKAVFYGLKEEEGYQPDPEEIEKKIGDKTRMLVLVNPSNPTGGVLSRETLEALVRLCVKHDLLIVSDETYEKIRYSGEPHATPAQIPGGRERTIIVNGFSKAYAMTGWRLGYVVAPKDLIDPMVRLHMYTVTHPSSIVQWAGLAALKGPQEPVAEMVQTFKERRDFMVEALNTMKGLSFVKPEGAFYLFPNIKKTNLSSHEFCRRLLREAYVGLVPGTVFGEGGEGYVRISYAASLDNLKKAAERMKAALETWS